ncbi:MAG: helix-turn-helix domain-containing protein [Candidatus Nanopelagicales bacterium]
MPAATVARFAELVFAYIDELSAASVSGHTDELATTGRVRKPPRAAHRAAPRRRRRGAPAGRRGARRVDAARDAHRRGPAARAGARPALGAAGRHAARARGPPRHRRRRRPRPAARARLRRPTSRRAAAHAVAPRRGRRSCAPVAAGGRVVRPRAAAALPRARTRRRRQRRAPRRARPLGGPVGVRRPALPSARAHGLRCAPPQPSGCRRRCARGLLHQGRRDDVAAGLHVHAQTVRYRMGQVRELYGESLDDPDVVRDLVLALAADA